MILSCAISLTDQVPGTAGASVQATRVWNQFVFSYRHASLNPFERLINAANVGSLTLTWNGPADPNPICCSSPVGVGGTVHAATGDNRLRAYRASDGMILWNSNVGGGQVSTPAVNVGKVFVGSGDWSVYAFDAASGVQAWTYNKLYVFGLP